MSDLDPEAMVQLGAACVGVGRWMQRTYPAVTNPGGQSGEDAILASLLPQPDGCYVDIGANHGIQCSNTWQFYQRGWRGLLIDPLPETWYRLVQQRPGDWFSFNAVGNCHGFAELRACRDASTIRPDVHLDEQVKMVVEVDTLANILARYPACIREQCRLCSIDVEGWEKDVLEGIDWKTFRPEVFCVEWKMPDTTSMAEAEKWLPILTRHGYAVANKTAYNLILKR
jgi:FkbM family methyltransferase